ncbi:MAG TPA: WXG100 family type VII secretion target [Acidimicrobiales bacterium]|nr:WXG100 family type VII secretion target [Acidimicrobiales bacterium]
MSDLLKLTPTELQTRANNINSMVDEMASYFDRELTALQGTDWQGAAGDAYKDMFGNARRSFKGVEDNLRGCSNLLVSMKDGFQEMDATMARRVASGGA